MGLEEEKAKSQRGCIIHPGPQVSDTRYPRPGSCYHVSLERENRTTSVLFSLGGEQSLAVSNLGLEDGGRACLGLRLSWLLLHW